MPTTTNFQLTGAGEREMSRIREAVTAALGSRPGRWHVQFIGNRDDLVWELRVSGRGVEISEYLDRGQGQHEPAEIAAILGRLIPG